MIIEDQVASFDLCKKLKELNVKQESYFTHIFHPYYEWVIYETISVDKSTYRDNERYSAFTVAELFKLLRLINGVSPQLIKGILMADTEIKYCCRYEVIDVDNSIFLDTNPANSCAKMLIYLIENKLMDISC